MCRWFAYSGSPVPIETFLLQPEYSLIDQSLHSRMGVVTTNGDGFGMGWYDDKGELGLYRSTSSAWNDQNLRELAVHVQSSAFLAHVRASTGTPTQQTNCHPFRHGRWLWMHNGLIRSFSPIKRDLTLAIDPSLFASVEGSTDSEVMFYLALTKGPAEDPAGAVERMAGLVERTAENHGVENSLRMSIATTDGEPLWVFRYSTERDSPSLYYTTDVRILRELYPDSPRLEGISDRSGVPEASCGLVQAGDLKQMPFGSHR